eukprot:COSAG02_NODE_205_length_29157_cov_13.424771_13_plen_94_part_00
MCCEVLLIGVVIDRPIAALIHRVVAAGADEARAEPHRGRSFALTLEIRRATHAEGGRVVVRVERDVGAAADGKAAAACVLLSTCGQRPHTSTI